MADEHWAEKYRYLTESGEGWAGQQLSPARKTENFQSQYRYVTSSKVLKVVAEENISNGKDWLIENLSWQRM